ncbi:MAG: hypothetical protein BAA01_12965 [Bacillus thermozeamaize]|uniref:non-specific serine/threonine protein kinase n=1 Tax=Bacillus thermozeamaize TaxID=230954 RepID=A0A1Y3PRE9_9BACI|nr:MAG: hypothetical protein BAA01_12965 [Bacillus thermozeamaize]
MIGKVLNQRYQVIKRLGSGGMATVYQGLDLEELRFVSLKVLKEQFVHDEAFTRRFQREAEAVSRLSHPNIVRFYGVGKDHGIPYIVMEYVEGETLKEKISRQAPLPVDEAVRIAMEICDALEYAHRHQIVHRDIKPHNVLISTDGKVKVTDFGIAQASSEATITHGTVIGSVHYCSPEQAKGTVVSGQSDLYSLGVVLYEMLTGELPFSGDTPVTVALKHLQEPYPPAYEKNQYIPQSLENVLARALAKDPRQRYQSAAEMRADLAIVLQSGGVIEPPQEYPEDEQATRLLTPLPSEHRAVNASEFQPADEFQPDDESAPSSVPKRRLRWWMSLALVMLTAVLVVAGWMALDRLQAKWNVPEVVTPNVVGLPEDEAVRLLKNAGLEVERFEVENEGMSPHHVVRQDPPGDLKVKVNRTVRIWVNTGPASLTLPSLAGRTRQEAVAELENLGLSYSLEEEYSHRVPKGEIIRHDPPSQSTVIPGRTTVKLVVSAGPEMLTMIDLRGLSLKEAETRLLEKELSLGRVYTQPSDEQKGTVLRQFPYEPGQPVPIGSEVDLWVSSGRPEED